MSRLIVLVDISEGDAALSWLAQDDKLSLCAVIVQARFARLTMIPFLMTN